jgi:hypothetical protein
VEDTGTRRNEDKGSSPSFPLSPGLLVSLSETYWQNFKLKGTGHWAQGMEHRAWSMGTVPSSRPFTFEMNNGYLKFEIRN